MDSVDWCWNPKYTGMQSSNGPIEVFNEKTNVCDLTMQLYNHEVAARPQLFSFGHFWPNILIFGQEYPVSTDHR